MRLLKTPRHSTIPHAMSNEYVTEKMVVLTPTDNFDAGTRQSKDRKKEREEKWEVTKIVKTRGITSHNKSEKTVDSLSYNNDEVWLDDTYWRILSIYNA